MEEKSDKDGRGGTREGAGRKPKADEEKTNSIFLAMIKDVKRVDTDDEAKQALAKELMGFDRGVMFIAEHLFGKPKEKLDLTSGDSPIKNFNLSQLTDQELSVILKLHAGQPINTDGE
ncbi:hypothetical protein D3C86_537310 [compost metagenome]